jgi:recombination protein RecT
MIMANLKDKLACKANGVDLPKKEPKATFSNFMTQDGVKAKINQIIGGKDGQRFMTAILSAVSTNPALGDCDHSSILSAALLGETLKLSPSPQLGLYYMVPFDDNKLGRKVAVFVLGYRGYLQLAMRSGYYKKINVIAIKEGELIRFDPLNEEIECLLIDDEEARENAKTIGYYAMFEYMNGFRKVLYWSKKKMEAHALQYSAGYRSDVKKGYSYTFWSKDFDSMAFKTMLRQIISKWGIMSIDLQAAYEKDTGLIREDGTIDYIDNGDQGNTVDIRNNDQVEQEDNIDQGEQSEINDQTPGQDGTEQGGR